MSKLLDGVREFETEYGVVINSPKKGKRVAVVAYPQMDLLDFSGPVEVLHLANLALNSLSPGSGHAYNVVVLSSEPEMEVQTGSGVHLKADAVLKGYRGSIHTLLVPGGMVSTISDNEDVLKAIERLSNRAERTVSVCSGALLLGAAGLLDGRKATTHWRACPFLERNFPTTSVEPNAIYVRDGEIYTSAGSTTGIDLMLKLVEDDYGHEIAMHVARDMVIFLRRSGGQSQFSESLHAQARQSGAFSDLVSWVANNLCGDLRIETLAKQSNMSLRNFVRQFPKEMGQTPAKYVESIRLESARQMLEQSSETLGDIAASCGFGTTKTMRRRFLETLGVSPTEYRRSFKRQV